MDVLLNATPQQVAEGVQLVEDMMKKLKEAEALKKENEELKKMKKVHIPTPDDFKPRDWTNPGCLLAESCPNLEEMKTLKAAMRIAVEENAKLKNKLETLITQFNALSDELFVLREIKEKHQRWQKEKDNLLDAKDTKIEELEHQIEDWKKAGAADLQTKIKQSNDILAQSAEILELRKKVDVLVDQNLQGKLNMMRAASTHDGDMNRLKAALETEQHLRMVAEDRCDAKDAEIKKLQGCVGLAGCEHAKENAELKKKLENFDAAPTSRCACGAGPVRSGPLFSHGKTQCIGIGKGVLEMKK